MYYISVETRKGKESGKEYDQLRVMDRNGVARTFFPAYGFDLKSIPSSMLSQFPTKMNPVYILFDFVTGSDGQRDLRVASVSEADE